MLRRILATAIATAAILTTSPLGPSAQARPASQSTTCTANLTALFRPGLTLSQQTQLVKVTGSLSGCVGGGVSSAVGTGTGSGSLSCLAGTATGSLKVKWDTGETSKVSVSIDVGNGSVTGTVVSGKFAGEDATGSLTVTPVIGDCIFTPVTKATATGSVSL